MSSPNPPAPDPKLHYYPDGLPSVQRKWTNPERLSFYRAGDVLYQLTVIFCDRFLPPYGDRTRDQMIQAARSTKQNIIEGTSDGQTSMETELKLLGVARGSVQELLADFKDYLLAHGYTEWYTAGHPRMQSLRNFCKRIHVQHRDMALLRRMTDEELANMGVCLCHMTDYALTRFIRYCERDFVLEGGIRERMTKARLQVRETEYQTIRRLQTALANLQAENTRLKAENTRLQAENTRLQAALANLKG